MPILAREPDCFPADLFEGELLSSDTVGGGWWLAYTRSRREKDLARRLRATGVPFYFPTIVSRSRSAGGRIREAFVPLFPGYVFVHGAPEARLAALGTNCVSAISAVRDPARLSGELRSIRRLIASGVPVTPESRLQAGAPVRVVKGPLRGQEGVVIDRLGRRRLLVAVELLQRGASADVDECDLEPL